MKTLANAFARRLPPRPRAQRTRGVALLDAIRGHPRVASIEGRAEGFADWFVYLKPGWRDSSDPMDYCHCFGEATLTAIMRKIRAAIPCDCEECQRELKE